MRIIGRRVRISFSLRRLANIAHLESRSFEIPQPKS
jgi:hypothetical protein